VPAPRTCKEKCFEFVCEECCPNACLARTAAEGDASQLLIHSQMYQIGDKYDVTGLKELAREKFKRACTKYWDDECLAPAAHHAFSTTVDEDTGLKKVIIQVISDHIDLLNKPEVMTLLYEFSSLAVGLLQKRAEDLGWDISKDVESNN
jgi:aminopeptidase N